MLPLLKRLYPNTLAFRWQCPIPGCLVLALVRATTLYCCCCCCCCCCCGRRQRRPLLCCLRPAACCAACCYCMLLLLPLCCCRLQTRLAYWLESQIQKFKHFRCGLIFVSSPSPVAAFLWAYPVSCLYRARFNPNAGVLTTDSTDVHRY